MARTHFGLRVDADEIERARRLAPTVAAAQRADQRALFGPITPSAVVRLAIRRGLDALEAEHGAGAPNGEGRQR